MKKLIVIIAALITFLPLVGYANDVIVEKRQEAKKERMNELLTIVASAVEEMMKKGVEFVNLEDNIYEGNGKKSAVSPSYKSAVRLSLIDTRLDDRLIAVHDSLLGEQIYFRPKNGKYMNVYVSFQKDLEWEVKLQISGEPLKDENRFILNSFYDADELKDKIPAIRNGLSFLMAPQAKESEKEPLTAYPQGYVVISK